MSPLVGEHVVRRVERVHRRRVDPDGHDAEVREVPDQLRVETGEFAADMKVDLCNDGPVTLMLDSRDWKGRPTSE